MAIHDPDPSGHNPHCHIMLTMRAIDEQGNWLPKSRKVYDLDEHGQRVRLPSGSWKCHTEKTVDWDEQYHCEEWRHGWETVQNRYLEMVQSKERVDLRSYERQGMEIPLPEMPKELEAKPEKEQQHHEERAENAMQAYIRYVRETREQQKKQRPERKRTGDMER